ncbi:MAG: sugar-transfer associated ATP-grasp domain-containing protein [Pseudomonadota bacterium]
MNIATADQEAYDKARQASTQDLLVHAARASGLSPLQIQKDAARVAAMPGRLQLWEYVRLGLFHPDRFAEDERAAFIANELHWPIVAKINDSGWTSAAEDKALSDTLLRASGVPVPQTLGVIDRVSGRVYPGHRKVTGVDGLREMLAEAGGARVFCKIVKGMVSFGAMRIDGHDDTHIQLAGQPPVTYGDFLEKIVGQEAYLCQKEVINHPKIAEYAAALATVRVVNLVTPNGVRTPRAVIKLAQGDNIADAFWRDGNLACDIDVATGRIQTVAARGIEMRYLDDHPERAGLMGLVLPHWDDLLAVNEQAAQVYAPIRYQSTDIAITEAGPVVVELNYGGGFDLPQYASGRGLLTDDVLGFFASHDVDLATIAGGAKTKKKKGLFGLGG